MPEFLKTVPIPEPIPGQYWVYILQSTDSSLYIGQTCNVPERLRKHRLGLGSKHTHDHTAPRLIFLEESASLAAAVQRERQLKGWSRDKKLALVTGDLARLKELSRRRNECAPP